MLRRDGENKGHQMKDLRSSQMLGRAAGSEMREGQARRGGEKQKPLS